jgi:hypothetical protein
MEDIFEDNEAVIGNHKLKKTDHTMFKNKQDKGTNNNLQNSTQKTQNGASRTPQKREMNPGDPEGLSVSALLVAPVVLL